MTAWQRLADHRQALIELLQQAHARGRSTQPFDPAYAWSMIERHASLGGAVSVARRNRTQRADCRDQALELADALGKARKILGRTTGELRRELLDAWSRKDTGGAVNERNGTAPVGIHFVTEAEEAEVTRLQDLFQCAVDAIAALGVTAKQVAERNRNSRGNQKGSGALPPIWVAILSFMYQDSTGLKPTVTGTGPFASFVREVADAMEIELGDDGMADAIKRGLRELKKLDATLTARGVSIS